VKSTHERGREGEDAACRWLESQGLVIVERNFRSTAGEVDIVARDGETLAFVEVKFWRSLPASELGYAIGASKRRRIIETSKFFLLLHREYYCWRVRYDVLLIRGDNGITHLRDAFTETL
jgi:putative endonuclease